MTIEFVLLVNRQGQTRLAQYLHYTSVDERAALESEVARKCLQRRDDDCSVVEHLNYKLIYRRYASLLFIVGVSTASALLLTSSTHDASDDGNTSPVHMYSDSGRCSGVVDDELAIYEFIQCLVEVMDRYFDNVCELDVMLNVDKAHFILDEMLCNGVVADINHERILQHLALLDGTAMYGEQRACRDRNPLEHAVDTLVGGVRHVYSDYLYASGTLLVLWCAWGVYPGVARWRHARIARYTRLQAERRCRLFATPHLPRWRTSLLEQLVVPTSVVRVSCTQQQQQQQQQQAMTSHQCAATCTSDGQQVGDHGCDTREARVGDDSTTSAHAVASRPCVRLVMCPATVFANATAAQVCRHIQDEVAQVNARLAGYVASTSAVAAAAAAAAADVTTTATTTTAHDGARTPAAAMAAVRVADDAFVRSMHDELRGIVTRSGAVIVKRTRHWASADMYTSRSPHDDCGSSDEAEIWWLSVDEAQRRRFCVTWALVLLVGRLLQDLFYMPDMPMQ